MPGKCTRDAQLSLLLPMAISQGWTVRELATRANISTESAMLALREGAKQAETAIKQVVSVDALALSVDIQGKTRTLGQIQGRMVTGAARSLATLPENPHEWTQSNDQTYRRCQTILRDAKALGLIRFGEQKEGGISSAMRAIDPFLSQDKPAKRGETEKPQQEQGSVNDGVDSSSPPPVDSPLMQGEGGE